jgi:hypothetical protein
VCFHKKEFINGASTYQVYQERLDKGTGEKRKASNYDAIDKSRNILRKIKSEGIIKSLLIPNSDQGLFKLYEKFKNEINVDDKIKDAIQQISRYPCQITVYSESSIYLFHALLKHKNVVLSWDATGSIMQEFISATIL